MYVKLFASLYQGTLRGCSNEILVFTNMLAHADQYGIVDKHPRAIAEETGLSREAVDAAILNLESPDIESRSPEEEGRRIIQMDIHRAWGWKIVNYGKYRSIKSEDDRREQNRLAQERFRNKSKPPSAIVSLDKPPSAQAEAEAEADTEEPKPTPSVKELACQQVYELYPRKVSKPTGLKAIGKAIDRETKKLGGFDAALSYLKIQTEKYQRSPGVITRIGREEINFIPYPATWFRQERYNDEHDWGKERINGLSKDEQRTERNKKAIARTLGRDVD